MSAEFVFVCLVGDLWERLTDPEVWKMSAHGQCSFNRPGPGQLRMLYQGSAGSGMAEISVADLRPPVSFRMTIAIDATELHYFAFLQPRGQESVLIYLQEDDIPTSGMVKRLSRFMSRCRLTPALIALSETVSGAASKQSAASFPLHDMSSSPESGKGRLA